LTCIGQAWCISPNGWRASKYPRSPKKPIAKMAWLESVGTGAFSDKVISQLARRTLRHKQQAKLPIHAGALTALSLQGLSHYFRVTKEKFSFSHRQKNTASWFANHSWDQPIEHIKNPSFPRIRIRLAEETQFRAPISAPKAPVGMFCSLHLHLLWWPVFNSAGLSIFAPRCSALLGEMPQ